MELNNKEMYEINGGGVSWGVVGAALAALIYVIGIFNGYTNPNRCNN